MTSLYASAFTLPNGQALRNRLVKAATEELLADSLGRVSPELIRLYQTWSSSGADLIITGNLFVSPESICRPGNGFVSSLPSHFEGLKALALATKSSGAKAIAQLNHAGRQALRRKGVQAKAPSPIGVKGFGPLFSQPAALTEQEIASIQKQFVKAAQICLEAGFDGVEVHSAHGYLLSQFLSPLSNTRNDAWGGSLRNRSRLLLNILDELKRSLPPSFILGLKLNSADFQRGGFAAEEGLAVIDLLAPYQLDFLEISGGSYESPAMMGVPSSKKREAYFLDFAEKARQRSAIPLLLTGGFRSASAMDAALQSRAIDLIGIARPMLMEPQFPQRLLNDGQAVAWQANDRIGIKKIDDLLQSLWYKQQIHAIAQGKAALGANRSPWLVLLQELPILIWQALRLALFR